MGLFGLFKRRIETRPDLVWLTCAMKWKGLGDEVARVLEEDALVIVVAHFPETLREIETALRRRGMDCLPRDHRIDRRCLLCEVGDPPGRLWLALADRLCSDDLANPSIDGDRCVSVIVGERHPLAARDDGIETFARAVPYRCRLGYHISLHDPLIRVFTNEWSDRMVRMLGIPEDEPLSGDLLARHLRRACRKIERQAVGDEPCDSAAEWMRKNCPGLARFETRQNEPE